MPSPRMPESRQSSSAPALSGFSAYHIPVLILVSMGAMAVALSRMDSVILGWRPTDLASIALNYYRNGFHFLYPQIHWGGNGPGFVEMEFPVVQYVTALLYTVFGVHDALGLLIPLLSALGTVLAVYLTVEYIVGPVPALGAGVCTAISPSLI